MHMWHLVAFVGDRTLGPIVSTTTRTKGIAGRRAFCRSRQATAGVMSTWLSKQMMRLGMPNRKLQGHLTDLLKAKPKARAKARMRFCPLKMAACTRKPKKRAAKALAKAKVARNHVASAIQDLENAVKMATKSKRMSASKKDAEDALKNGQQRLAILNTSFQTKTGSGEEIQSVIKAPASGQGRSQRADSSGQQGPDQEVRQRQQHLVKRRVGWIHLVKR